MVDGNGAHPSPDRLVAFAQGRLSEDDLVAMSRHLQRCPGCLAAAESMPGDFFAATLRQYAPRTAPSASKGAGEAAGGMDKGRPAAPAPPAPQPPPAPAAPSGAKPPAVARPVAAPVAPAVAPVGVKPPPAPAAPPLARPVAPPASGPQPVPPPARPAAAPARPAASAKKPATPPAPVPPAITGYQDFYVVGEGGMGVVYRAWQPNLKRWVALKVIRFEALADPNLLARFKKEAQGIARLRHPNIVTLYDISEFEGQPYLLLEYVDGGSLADRWNHAPQPPKEAAYLVEVLALAMQHAHDEKLVHRDLKPGNILLTREGQPKITDFGLVKRLHSSLGPGGSDSESSLSLTMTSPGTIMGTPNYMAPEQIWGGSADIDARVDVYALGALLYEGLTGRPPFRGATVHQTLDLVLHSPPKPPREIRPEVPSDLEAVCLKALAKEAKERYVSARDFAEDLQRFLHDRPVLARQRRFHERALGWLRSRARSATALSAVAVALAVMLALSIYFLIKERRQTAEARVATADALAEKEQRDRLAYAGSIGLAQRAWEEGRTGQAVRLLEELRQDLRGWEWGYLWGVCHTGDRLTAAGFRPAATAARRPPNADQGSGPVRCIACSSDGRLLATGGDDGKVRLWDARSGTPFRTLSGHKGRVNRVAFGGNGEWLVSACDDQQPRVWDVRGDGPPEPRYVYLNHERPVLDVLFTANGGRVYSTSDDGSVQGWDPKGETVHQILQASGGPLVRQLALAGSRLFGATDKGLVAWKTDTGTPDSPPRLETGPIRCVTASADGKYLALGTADAIQLRKLESLEVVCTFRAPRVPPSAGGSAATGGPTELAFSADGSRLAGAGPDQVVRVWDCAPGGSREIFTPLRMFRGHDRAVTGVCFDPDGKRLFSASADHSVKAWSLNAPPEPSLLLGGERGTRDAVPRPARALAFGPGGRLAAIGDDLIVRSWAGTQSEPESLDKPEADREPPAAVDISFGADGKWIASATSDGTARLWDANQARIQEELRHPNNRITWVCFDPTGKRLATGDNAGGVRLWDVDKPKAKEIRSFKGLARSVGVIAFGAQGKRLAAGGDRTVKVWDVESGKELFSREAPEGELKALALSGDGKLLATGGDDQTARLWDTESGKLLFTLEGHAGPVTGLAFSPDGRRLATAGGGSDTTVRLWDVETGRELLQLAGAGRCVAFSPDGQRLAAASAGRILLWSADPWK